MPQRAEVLLIYLAGLAQGLALVTFPAASSIFTGPHGYGLSVSRYGLMFIPQVILAFLLPAWGLPWPSVGASTLNAAGPFLASLSDQAGLVFGCVDAKLDPKATASETMRIAPAIREPKE